MQSGSYPNYGIYMYMYLLQDTLLQIHLFYDRLIKFFVNLQPRLFEAALTGVKARLTEKDGKFRGAWLLTE